MELRTGNESYHIVLSTLLTRFRVAGQAQRSIGKKFPLYSTRALRIGEQTRSSGRQLMYVL